MQLTKFTHSCVRFDDGDRALVIDPGAFTDPGAAEGATAVLVTHEHQDHLDLDQLRATDAPVYTISDVRDRIAEADGAVAERVQVVSPGQQFDAGVPVTAVGELHAVIHEEMPRFHNSGFVVDVGGTRVYHPGDSFTPAGGPVDLLLLPVHAPWSKISEVVDFARAVGARHSVAVHDGLLNDTGLAVVGRTLDLLVGDDHAYERVTPGTDLRL